MRPETNSNDFGGFILIRFLSLRKLFFDRFDFLVCSKFNHTQFGRTCACAVACLCPHNSITNVLVFVTIHDDTDVYAYNYKRCSNVEGRANRSLYLGFGGERQIEPPGSWFPPRCPSGELELSNFIR